MKVVIFCGGQGMRLREYSSQIPKPLVPVGDRPILWHVMKYYAHFGHKDFILCLGYRGDVIRDYFLNRHDVIHSDFVLSEGGRRVELFDKSDIEDWRISFVDTGLESNIGQRLLRVRGHLGSDEVFLANYGDTLTDLHLPNLISLVAGSDAVAAFLAVRPTLTFHVVEFGSKGSLVAGVQDVNQSDTWINGGYFVFRREIFDVIDEGDELVEQPFRRLIKRELLLAHRHKGFWAPMDTLKDRQTLETLWEQGRPPWGVWRPPVGIDA